jgi:hypothetical protein
MKQTAESYRPLVEAIVPHIAEFIERGLREFAAAASAEWQRAVVETLQAGRGRLEFRMSLEPATVALLLVPVDGTGAPVRLFTLDLIADEQHDWRLN